MDYYSSTAFNHYRNQQDSLDRLANTINFYDTNLEIVEIEKPLTSFEIELQIAKKEQNVNL